MFTRHDYEEEVRKGRASGHHELEVMGLEHLGNLDLAERQPGMAVEHFQQALQMRESVGDAHGVALLCRKLALIYELALRDTTKAHYYLEKGADSAHRLLKDDEDDFIWHSFIVAYESFLHRVSDSNEYEHWLATTAKNGFEELYEKEIEDQWDKEMSAREPFESSSAYINRKTIINKCSLVATDI